MLRLGVCRVAGGLIVRDGGRTLIAEARVEGYFILDEKRYRNRFTRNMGYIIDGLLRRADVTVYIETGGTVTQLTSQGGLLYAATGGSFIGVPLFFHWGTGTTSPSVTDNDLSSPDAGGRVATHYIDVMMEATNTLFIVAGRFSPDVDKSYTEVGLKLLNNNYYHYVTLLARSILSPAVSRKAYTDYFDGYVLNFPANFTRTFVKALLAAVSGYRGLTYRGSTITAVDGSSAVVRTGDTFAGSPDVMIGTNNSDPSPAHYSLLSPIASLGSQTQVVEVDTTLNQVRVVRIGSYTPSTDTILGEVGLFCNVNAFVSGNLVTRKIMVCRVAISPPVTLKAGTSYTLGIALAF